MPVKSGDPLQIPARKWNAVEQLIAADQIGAVGAGSAGPYTAAVVMRAYNAGAALEADRICATTGPALDPETVKSGRSSPLVTVGAAAWHTSLGNLAVAIDPIPAGKIGRVAVAGVTTAFVDVLSTAHGFASLDPAAPTALRSSDTGEIKLVGTPTATGSRLCLVHLAANGSPLWRHKLTADFVSGSVAANLHRLDGTIYAPAAAITVTDSLGTLAGKKTNAEGYCRQVGNTFHAAAVPSVAVTLVADNRFDTATGKWEKRFQTVRVLAADDIGPWTDYVTGSECNTP